MARAKEKDMWFEILQILSYPLIATYLVFLSPSLTMTLVGDVSPPERAYWLVSGVIYTISLIGTTKWKKAFAIALVAIILLDALFSMVTMDSPVNSILNFVHATLWVAVLRTHWKFFE